MNLEMELEVDRKEHSMYLIEQRGKRGSIAYEMERRKLGRDRDIFICPYTSSSYFDKLQIKYILRR